MGSVSNYVEAGFLNHLVKNDAFTPSGTIYLGLSIADPTDTGGGISEPGTGDGYSRKAITFGAASNRAITQNADVVYDASTATWGTISHYIIADNDYGTTFGTDVNMLAHGSLTSDRLVVAGNTITVTSGSAVITVTSGGQSDYLANKFLDFVFRNQTFDQPTNIYVAMCSGIIDQSDTGSTIQETAMTGYSRQLHNVWSTAAEGAPSSTTNSGIIDFGTLSGTANTMVALGLVDQSSAGNLLVYDSTISQLVNEGDSVSIPNGNFTVSLD